MEGDGTVVRQDELMRWQEPSTPGGAHSRAWAVLNNNRSQFIARNLGIGDPAKAQMCLGCHRTAGTARAVPAADGVGCESCHGPEGGWPMGSAAGRERGGQSVVIWWVADILRKKPKYAAR